MSGVELKANDAKAFPGIKRRSVLTSIHVVPILVTLAAVAVAAVTGWQAWQYYMGAPWTRDGTVRAYVVKIAPEVAGEIVKLPIVDNQFVHKGDLLMLIDPRNYSIAVRQAEATVEQTRATSVNANAEMTRRLKLSDIAVTMEERQTYVSQAATAEANYQSALANLEQARINFKRTEVRSPVNGYVTNLTAQLGDYANVGDLQLSVVNSDSYWVDAYFEETALGRIREGDAATIKLMGYSALLRGTVQGLARGINVPNAAPDASGLASVNPIFTFVRLAQRVPVRIRIDEVPEGVELVAGLTATVQVEPNQAPSVSGSKPFSANVSEAAPRPAPLETRLDASRQSAPPQAAPSHVTQQATPSAPPSKAAGQPASQAAQPQAAPQPAQSSFAQSAAPETSADELAVSIPPSPQASAAADAASADLKTLEEQIAANPPSGAGSSPTAGNRGNGASADAMGPSEYLGQTVDLYDGQTIIPAPAHRSVDSLHRRARPRWRHGWGHQ
jgi:multidrug resistance efflux pump